MYNFKEGAIRELLQGAMHGQLQGGLQEVLKGVLQEALSLNRRVPVFQIPNFSND